MKNITTKSILSPFAVALLIATTGCALDQDEAPDTANDDTQSSNYVIADNGGNQFVDAKQGADWNYADTTKRAQLRDKTTKIPSDQQPEGENENENEGGEGENEGGPTKLDRKLMHQLADAITFVSPLRVAGDLTETEFVDLDLGGVLTTSAQGIDHCRMVNFDRKTKILDISFDCGDLGDNAPTGKIRCHLSYPEAGEARLACRLTVESAIGTSTGKINVKYAFGTDSAHISLRVNAPQTLMGHINIEARHDIGNMSSFNVEGTTQEHTSHFFVTTDNTFYSVVTANVLRAGNDCRPSAGQYTIDTFDSLQEEDSDRFVLSGTAGSWIAYDGASSEVQIPICN